MGVLPESSSGESLFRRSLGVPWRYFGLGDNMVSILYGAKDQRVSISFGRSHFNSGHPAFRLIRAQFGYYSILHS